MDKIISKCVFCGSKSQKTCPGIEKSICSVCCGTRRGNKIHCVSSCIYFPFNIAGYNLWLEVDAKLVPKMYNYLKSYYTYNEFEEVVEYMYPTTSNGSYKEDVVAENAALHYLLFVSRDAEGNTLAQELQRQGWPGLNNDERLMMEYRMNCRVTVIEIQKILDHQRMECIDLLAPEKGSFILIDRATAARSIRFMRMLTWLTHYPNFSRINSGIVISDFVFEKFMEVLNNLFRKERHKNKNLVINDYLSQHFGIFCRFVSELGKKTGIAMLKSIDMHHCKAFYKIKGNYADIKAVLDNKPDFEQDEMDSEKGAYYYIWLRRGQSKDFEKKMPVYYQHRDENEEGVGIMGKVILLQDELIIEILTRKKYAFAKKMLKKFFGNKLRLQREIVVDLAKQEALRRDEDDEEYPPEQILEEKESRSENFPPEVVREIMEKFYKRFYTNFLNDKIPALKDMTPLQCAANPQMRPKLIEVMKQHLKAIEMQNKEKGLDLNIDWVLNKLGLQELM